jgi:serine/threonine protein kinase
MDRQKIGFGSYGDVYYAVDSKTDKKVAMKRIRYAESNDGLTPFIIREVSILRSLSHPNLIRLLNVVLRPEDVVLVLEFMPVNLAGYIRHVGPLVPNLTRSYSFQLLAAVHTLHSHQIIHRDVKPSNLMINKDGILKLIDFGLARFFALPMPQYTPGVQTLCYRAPELLFQTVPYTTAIDVWSVGCVIAEMVRGRPLFGGTDSPLDLFHRMVEVLGTPDSPISPSVTVPEAAGKPMAEILGSDDVYLCDLLLNLLCYNPARRISALDALRHPYFDQLPDEVRRISAPETLI